MLVVSGNHPITILAVGDSITVGAIAASAGAWRYPLHNLLVAAGRAPTWIGSERENHFPGDHHEGHSSLTIADMALVFDAYSSAYRATQTPHLTLIELGTNNLPTGTATVEADMIDLLDSHIFTWWPTTRVVLGCVPTTYSGVPGTETYAAERAAITAIYQSIAAARSNVDVARTDGSLTASTQTRDGVHPTIAGHALIAADWFSALQTIGVC